MFVLNVFEHALFTYWGFYQRFKKTNHIVLLTTMTFCLIINGVLEQIVVVWGGNSYHIVKI
jgi:hypothetical protein